MWVTVVDVLMGEQDKVSVANRLRRKRDGGESLEVGGVEFLDGVGEVRVQVKGGARKTEPAA